MMRALDDLGVRETLLERIAAGVPFLGICLGHAGAYSSERRGARSRRPRHFPRHRAALSRGRARPAHGLERRSTSPSRLAGSVRDDDCPTSISRTATTSRKCRDAAATCTYEHPYTAVLEAGNVYGVQFHPEKSGPVGHRNREEVRGT